MTVTTPAGPAVTAGEGARTSRLTVAIRDRHLVSVTTAGLVLVAVVVALTRDFHPTGDLALPELFIRQMPHRLPVVGPYSLGRWFNHPSPLFFYLAAVPYWLTGERSSALLSMSLLVNGGALVAATWIAEQRRAPGLGIALVACVALTGFGHDPSFIVLPWNPYLAAIPFVTLVVASWAIWAGASRWTVPWVVALGSWCVGCHMNFAVPVAGIGLVVAAGIVVAVRAGRWAVRALVAPLLTAVAIAFVMWLPTLYDLVRNGRDSNLAAIVRFVTNPPVDRIPFVEALKVLSSELSLRPYWSGGIRPARQLVFPGHASWPLMVPLIVLALVLAARRHATREISGVLVALAGLTAAFVGVALTHSADLLSWYLVPAEMAGITVAAFTLWSLGAAIGAGIRARPDGARRARALVVVVGVVAVAAVGVRLVRADDTSQQRAVGAATAELTPAVLRRYGTDRPVQLVNVVATRDPQSALLLDLTRAGVPVTVPGGDDTRFGPWWSRTAPAGAIRLVLTPRDQPPAEADRRLVAVSRPTPFMLGGLRRLALWEIPGDAGARPDAATGTDGAHP